MLTYIWKDRKTNQKTQFEIGSPKISLYDLWKYSFTRNSLPENVVSANTVNTSKNSRLDKFWSDQELVYDYKADITGIGNRSLISLDDTSA